MASAATSYAYRRSADQDRRAPAHHPVIIIGAGPVGLTLALDLAKKGHRTVVIEKRTALSEGSRAVCWAKRSLEIMGRLGVGDRLVERGVTWQRGKVFHRKSQVFAFDLLPESGHQRPAFINLQQFHVEEELIAACEASDLVDLRWGQEVVRLDPRNDGPSLSIRTPEGDYGLAVDWLIAADGARSTIRHALGLGFIGQTFDDQFLICDIKMKADRPSERWFWFDPVFNPGQTALLHRQADDVWRPDFQIGPDADRDEETKPENVARRIRAMLGDIDFTFEWISCYRFHCRRLERFRHGRVIFVGDAAHQVSPFGARGGNSGVQDADNLGWKLDLVLRGFAPEVLIDSYGVEREQAADENILHSTRATDFISPKGPGAMHFRDAVLELAAKVPFARGLLNSGRLSVATTYDGSPLNATDGFAAGDTPAMRPGAAAADGPRSDGGWLLSRLAGHFTLLTVAPDFAAAEQAVVRVPKSIDGVPLETLTVAGGQLAERYGACDAPVAYLLRPDQHVAARWRGPDPSAVAAAVEKAIARR